MYDLRLKQSLGQNFLKDKNVAKKIVKYIEVDKDSTIIEIGPGDGAITGLLLEKFKQVIAVEIDKRFVDIIRKRYSSFPNFEILCEDFLKIDIRKFNDIYGKLNIVGNLPYHITSSVLFNMFENRRYINSAYLMIQREVSSRIVSPHKTKGRGILSVFSQYYCSVKSLFNVSKNVFYPVPKVDSSFIKFDFFERPKPEVKDEKLFISVVKLAFGKRRKYLRNSLKEMKIVDISALKEVFNLDRRPEELTVKEFVELTNLIYHRIS